MSFNPDKSKPSEEVVFSRKSHPPAIFNNMPVVSSSCQKHLGIYLDENLSFSNHIKENISKANKGIGILRKLDNVLPRIFGRNSDGFINPSSDLTLTMVPLFLTNQKMRVFVKNLNQCNIMLH